MTAEHLLTALQMAVPLEIERLRDTDPEQLAQLARDTVGTIVAHGDVLQYGGRGCGPAFGTLTRGLAAAALTAWGGINLAGAHWCPLPRCNDPDNPHPRPEGWHRQHQRRPVVDLHLPEPPPVPATFRPRAQQAA